jgi:hypothetical protein
MVERNVSIIVPEHMASRRIEMCKRSRHLFLPSARRIHSTPSQTIYLKYFLTFYSRLCSVLPSGLFPAVTTLETILPYPPYAIYSSNFILFDLTTYMKFGEGYRL